MSAQRTALKGRETSLIKQKRELTKAVKSHCDQLMLLADYRTKDNLSDLDASTIHDVAAALLKKWAGLTGTESRLGETRDGLYG